MARFEHIQKYMDSNANANKLVTCIEDYAKHSFNEGAGREVFGVEIGRAHV